MRSLLSLISPSPSLSTLLTSLLNSYIILFTSNKIPHDRRSLKTLELFSPHLENIPINELQTISDTIVSSISQIDRDPDEAQLLDLLPKCLHIIFNSNEIDKPQDSVDAVFDRILECNWSRILLVKLVSIIHEFKFSWSCFRSKIRGHACRNKIRSHSSIAISMAIFP